jgi:hypothetical protein
MVNRVHSKEIQIQIICQHLPGSQFKKRMGIRLGIQKGKMVIDDVGADASSANFTAALRVVQNMETGAFNFMGPFAQGSPQERFIYLCWGERKNDSWEGFSRAKLQLRPIDSDVVERALANGTPIQVVIDMTDAKGGPLCASIKADKIAWQW